MTYREKLELILAEGKPEVPCDLPTRRASAKRHLENGSVTSFYKDGHAEECTEIPGWFW